MLVVLRVGDPSRDGHGQTETYNIDHNLPSNGALKSAYEAGAAMLGFDFQEEVASEYEESWMTEEHVEALEQHNIIKEVFVNRANRPLNGRHWDLVSSGPIGADYAYEYSAHVHLNAELYVAIWMAIAQLGDPSLTYTVPKGRQPTLDIGGYGLFNL